MGGLTRILKDRVRIEVRAVTLGSLGDAEVWTVVATKYAHVIPVGAAALATYQQLESVVTHKVVFRGRVTLALGVNRLVWKEIILELVAPPLWIGQTTQVMVREP